MQGINGVPYKVKLCPACEQAFQYPANWVPAPHECGTCDPRHLNI